VIWSLRSIVSMLVDAYDRATSSTKRSGNMRADCTDDAINGHGEQCDT
jgi:hypothetical protein